jgi:hypothetical protein
LRKEGGKERLELAIRKNRPKPFEELFKKNNIKHYYSKPVVKNKAVEHKKLSIPKLNDKMNDFHITE